MNIIFGIAAIEDYDAIHSIVKEGHDEHVQALPHFFNEVENVMPKAYYKELLEGDNNEIIVAKEDGEIVGFAVMELCESPPFDSMTPRIFAYINDFGIKRTHQRGGIGSDLFYACVEWSKNKNASSLDLNVWEFNQKAISFYKHMGLKNVSRKMSLPL